MKTEEHHSLSFPHMSPQLLVFLFPSYCVSMVADIVFFGEALPDRFAQCAMQDMKKCDLLLIMGTSLLVHPFASLVDK